MKIQFASDLHIEFEREVPVVERMPIPVTDADVLVLAGDVGVGYDMESEYVLNLVEQHKKPVFFVMGNHSGYNREDIEVMHSKWTGLDEETDNLVYLSGHRGYMVGDTFFTGATLWTDFLGEDRKEVDKPRYMMWAGNVMNDFLRITYKDERFRPETSAQLHKEQLEGLRFQAHNRPKRAKKLVVVSHHAPSFKSVHPVYKHSSTNPAYASNLEDVMKELEVDLWIHGHMHHTINYSVANTMVVANPRGYHGHDMNPAFDPERVVSLD